jgi:hypothetical protein
VQRAKHFLQSFLSGALTLLVRNAIDVLPSGQQAGLLTYKVLATRLWSVVEPSSLSFSASSSTTNRSSAPGDVLVLAGFFYFLTTLKPSLSSLNAVSYATTISLT